MSFAGIGRMSPGAGAAGFARHDRVPAHIDTIRSRAIVTSSKADRHSMATVACSAFAAGLPLLGSHQRSGGSPMTPPPLRSGKSHNVSALSPPGKPRAIPRIAGAPGERVLSAGRGGAAERVAIAADLEGAIASPEDIAHAIMERENGNERFGPMLPVHYAAQA
jgi:hypothetical protein